MSPLPALDRRVPLVAVTVIAGVCAAVFMAGSAVAVSRDGSPRVPKKQAAAQAAPTASPTPTATPTATPATPPKPKPKKPKTVADYIAPIEDVLPEYIRVDETDAKSGAIDLNRAAALGDGKASARDKRVIAGLGFVKGHMREWDGEDSYVIVTVLQWKSSRDALRWVRLQRAIRQERRESWTPKTPNSAGGCQRVDGDALDAQLMAIGRRTYVVAVVRDGTCTKHTEVAKLSKVVYDYAAKLPR